MAAIELYVPNRVARQQKSGGGRTLKAIAEGLAKSLEGSPRCAESSSQVTLCVFGTSVRTLEVSVVDCCCNQHAKEALHRAEVALRRQLARPTKPAEPAFV